jgi:hypothetical protein
LKSYYCAGAGAGASLAQSGQLGHSAAGAAASAGAASAGAAVSVISVVVSVAAGSAALSLFPQLARRAIQPIKRKIFFILFYVIDD